MKLVREHIIFEKFTEDSDPIHDMGIGMENVLEDYFKKTNCQHFDVYRKLDILIKDKKFEYADFFIKYYYVDVNTVETSSYGFPLRNAAYNGNWEGAKLLISRGADLDKTIEKTSSMHPVSLKALIKLRNKILKESVNEKFVEDSDPIEDMGISYITVSLFPHFDTKNGKITSEYLQIGNDPSVKDFLKYLHDHHITYEIKKDTSPGRWPTVYFSGSKNTLIKMCEDMFDWNNLTAQVYIEQNRIKESVNEKFTEESDPIHDLGIGNKFAYIKEGDIVKNIETIKVKKVHENPDLYKMYTRKGRDHYPCTGVVVKVEHNHETNKLKLYIMFFSDKLDLNNMRESILSGEYKFDIKERQIYTTCYSTKTYENWNKKMIILVQ